MSFIDSGSTRAVFSEYHRNSDLPRWVFRTARRIPQFYCQHSTKAATTSGTGTVDFQVDNHDTDIQNNPGDAAFGFIAASGGTPPCENGQGACTFDWGLPFFYDRRVFTSIDLTTVPNEPKTPWWAY